MVAKFVYDALGRRMRKEINELVTEFRYDGENLVMELDNTGNTIASYTFGPGIDNPLVMHRGGDDYYYVKDGLGSVRALTADMGNAVRGYGYSAFGKIVEQTGDTGVGDAFAYTSREWENAVGLYYYRARWYDPNNGTFLNIDPAAGDAESSRELGYAYVRNNPVNTDAGKPVRSVWADRRASAAYMSSPG